MANRLLAVWNMVYMDWSEETISSPYRETAKTPDSVQALYPQLMEVQEETYIEFYEMLTLPETGHRPKQTR